MVRNLERVHDSPCFGLLASGTSTFNMICWSVYGGGASRVAGGGDFSDTKDPLP